MERGTTASMSEQSALAAMAVALDEAGHWAEIVDRRWRYVHMTDELRVSFGGHGPPADVPVGEHYFGATATEVRFGWRRGPRTPELCGPTSPRSAAGCSLTRRAGAMTSGAP
jgi:hypothetical protein